MDESLLIVVFKLNETYIYVYSQQRVKTELISIHFSKIKLDLHKRWMVSCELAEKSKIIPIRVPYKCLERERYSLKWWTS